MHLGDVAGTSCDQNPCDAVAGVAVKTAAAQHKQKKRIVVVKEKE